MAASLNFQFLAEEFAEHYGIADLDVHQGCALALSSRGIDLNIAYLEDQNELILVCFVGEVSDSYRESILSELLYANFASQQVAIGALGMSPPGTVTLNLKLASAGVTAGELSKVVDRMFHESQVWKARLAELNLAPTQTSESTDDPVSNRICDKLKV